MLLIPVEIGVRIFCTIPSGMATKPRWQITQFMKLLYGRSIGSGALTGLGGGLVMLVGVPADVSFSLYSQVKLASTLFTIYGIDTKEKSAQPLILAAAAGVTASELATKLGTSAGTKALRTALMAVPGKVFAEINKALGIKLISKAGEKTLVNVAKLMPFVGGVVGGTVNGAMMNACGHSTIAFIKALR